MDASASPGIVFRSPAQAWQLDSTSSACSGCLKGFTLTRRRHHCRGCGRVFCHECTSQRVRFGGLKNPQRVCSDCLAAKNMHGNLPMAVAVPLSPGVLPADGAALNGPPIDIPVASLLARSEPSDAPAHSAASVPLGGEEKSGAPSFSGARSARGKMIELHAADQRNVISLSNGYTIERAVDVPLPMWRLLRSGVGDKPFVDTLRLHAGLLACDIDDIVWKGNIYVLTGAGLRLHGDRNMFGGSWMVSENACLPVSNPGSRGIVTHLHPCSAFLRKLRTIIDAKRQGSDPTLAAQRNREREAIFLQFCCARQDFKASRGHGPYTAAGLLAHQGHAFGSDFEFSLISPSWDITH